MMRSVARCPGLCNIIPYYKPFAIVKTSPLRKGSTKIRKPNIEKIRKLGFKPKYTLDQGLKEIIFN